jgi:glycosyltransferase involved in cell wall biosynthesis
MTSCPLISIVTPSLNQGIFIEETILSVLSQDYPSIEYILVDGGSKDATLDILKKYSDRIIWISEKDEGQAQAINKGLKMATGEIITYLNADDILLPGSLNMVARVFERNPDVKWVTGRSRIIDDTSKEIRGLITFYKNFLLKLGSINLFFIINFISQPATFWRRSLLPSLGLMDEALHYTMDYDYWMRLWQRYQPGIVHATLAGFRIHRNSKTNSSAHSNTWIKEERLVIQRHAPARIWLLLHDVHRLATTTIYSLLNH